MRGFKALTPSSSPAAPLTLPRRAPGLRPPVPGGGAGRAEEVAAGKGVEGGGELVPVERAPALGDEINTTDGSNRG